MALPSLSQAPPVLPTDVTGPGGGWGYSQDIRKFLLGPDRNTVPYNHGVIVARDCRYNFTGIWAPLNFAASGVACLPGAMTQSAVIAAATPKLLPPSVFVPTRDLDATRTPFTAEIMQTANASFAVSPSGQLILNCGALLIKVADGYPIDVASTVGDQVVNVRLASGAYTMISNFGGRMTVAQLSDNSQAGCAIMINGVNGQALATPLRVGHMAEIYPTCAGAAESELVAYTVLGKTPLPCGLTMEMIRFNYPRVLKRYNMTASIGDCDLRRILKSAASVSYVDREMEWLGMQPYAP